MEVSKKRSSHFANAINQPSARLIRLIQRHNVPDTRLYVSGPNLNTFRLDTRGHVAQQQAAVSMLNHSSQLKPL